MFDQLIRRKPETLVIAIAIAGVLAVLGLFTADLVITRHRELHTGEQRLRHFSLMMAEHTARSFEAVDSLLRDMAADLYQANSDWEQWEPSRGWDYVARRHTPAMSQIRSLFIFDRDGNQRFVSAQFPSPTINIRDRPYFIELQRGAPVAAYGPFVGRHTGRYTFAIARRLSDGKGGFAGAALATIEPAYLQEFCWPARLADTFEAVLTNAEGTVIASCRPADQTPQSAVLGQSAVAILLGGKPGDALPLDGVFKLNENWVGAAQVPGFRDLHILSTLPEKSLLINWELRLIELSVLGLLVSITLLLGALLTRQQVRKMSLMTEEVESARDRLEVRIKEATEAVADQRDAAERENTAKSRFLAAASHDLRQPMHALALFAADLQRQIRHRNMPELPHLAEQIAASTNALGERLDALLDISRIDVSGILPDKRPQPVAPLFERLEQAFRRTAEERGIRLKFRAGKHWVDTDAGLLERMLGNLIGNALRYTPRGGTVLVSARRRLEQIDLEVRDSGIGIAQEHHEAVFGEFYQVDNPAREKQQGLGLGLSIVSRLAQALDIRVHLRSRIGEGSTFSMRLPASSPHAVSPKSGIPTAARVAGKIIGIGDSDALLECLRLASTWGYQVSRQTEGMLTELSIDTIVISDAAHVETLLPHIPGDTPLVVLTEDAKAPLPDAGHALLVPVRPAKLRALVVQLQKARLKSTP